DEGGETNGCGKASDRKVKGDSSCTNPPITAAGRWRREADSEDLVDRSGVDGSVGDWGDRRSGGGLHASVRLRLDEPFFGPIVDRPSLTTTAEGRGGPDDEEGPGFRPRKPAAEGSRDRKGGGARNEDGGPGPRVVPLRAKARSTARRDCGRRTLRGAGIQRYAGGGRGGGTPRLNAPPGGGGSEPHRELQLTRNTAMVDEMGKDDASRLIKVEGEEGAHGDATGAKQASSAIDQGNNIIDILIHEQTK
ncbi:hypothetical protein THAOC_37222, partial [Thalassiosira oceanica]